MSSFIAVRGNLEERSCKVFGLQEADRKDFELKLKNHKDLRVRPTSLPYTSVNASPMVVLNALGGIGFKIITTCDNNITLWTLERIGS